MLNSFLYMRTTKFNTFSDFKPYIQSKVQMLRMWVIQAVVCLAIPDFQV